MTEKALQARPDLLLQPVTLSHAQTIFTLIDTNREHLSPWLPWVTHTRTSADTAHFLRQAETNFARGTAMVFLILHHGNPAGLIGLNEIYPEKGLATMGYWISKPEEGKGLITAAAAELVRYSFEVLRLERIEIRCEPENKRSRAIPLRLKFNRERLVKNATTLNGRAADHEVFVLEQKNWNPDAPDKDQEKN